jgi:hypothetical protein
MSMAYDADWRERFREATLRRWITMMCWQLARGSADAMVGRVMDWLDSGEPEELQRPHRLS